MKIKRRICGGNHFWLIPAACGSSRLKNLPCGKPVAAGRLGLFFVLKLLLKSNHPGAVQRLRTFATKSVILAYPKHGYRQAVRSALARQLKPAGYPPAVFALRFTPYLPMQYTQMAGNKHFPRERRIGV